MSYEERKANLCISAKILQFSVITMFFYFISSNKLNAQDTAYKKHEWGIAYEPFFDANYWEIHYKTFFKKKLYYNFHLAGLFDKHSTNVGKSTEYMIVPSAGLGVSLPFFRICRFNASVRVTGYIRQVKFDYTDSRSDGFYRSRGLFIGPDLGLEIIPFRNNKIQFSIFGDVHSGYGPMKVKYFSPSPPKEYRGNSTTGTFFGRAVIGISIRF